MTARRLTLRPTRRAGPMEVSQAAFARLQGCSRQNINKLVKEGKIPLTENRLINVEAAQAAIAENREPLRPGVMQDLSGESPGPEEGAEVQAQAPSSQVVPTIASAKADREAWEAKLKQLDYEQRVGELLPRAPLVEALVEAGRMIRQHLDQLPAMADEIAAAAQEGGTDAVRAVLRGKAREIETVIADGLGGVTDK